MAQSDESFDYRLQEMAKRAWTAMGQEANDADLAVNALCCLIAAVLRTIDADHSETIDAIATVLRENLGCATEPKRTEKPAKPPLPHRWN